MMNKRYLLNILGVAAISVLSACGSNDPVLQPNFYGYQGGCQNVSSLIPAGTPYTQIVRGDLGAGATLSLQIYDLPAGGIAAVGDLNVPSMESLSGLNYGSGGFTYPGYTAPAVANTPRRACLSSTGIGLIDGDGTYQDVEMSLSGDGVLIEMGRGFTWLSGNKIMGGIRIKFPEYPQFTDLILP
jgi:hypothetical protein